jgi:replicative DNA helicase
MEEQASPLRSYGELISAYARERSEHSPVVRLGFGSLDADMRGISPGQVCGFAARTAVGKTWALATVEHNCMSSYGVLSLSLEMPGLEWAERALAIYADVAPEQVEIWARQKELVERAASFVAASRNVVLCEEPVHITNLGTLIEQARKRVPVRVVMVDYLGLLTANGRDSYERASTIGKTLKEVAKRMQVCIVVAMQLSRAGGDGSTAVTLDMLRDSGVIEESMDFVIGCWRPGRNNAADPVEQLALQDVMRCQLLKNRKGPDGRVVDLTFREHSRKLFEQATHF